MANNILSGIQVLDFTRVVAGPYCTRILADLGARVIKVDELPRGEAPIRSNGSASNNAGKRSIAIDLKQATGLEVAQKLAANADVLVGELPARRHDPSGFGLPEYSRVQSFHHLRFDFRILADWLVDSSPGFWRNGPCGSRLALGTAAGCRKSGALCTGCNSCRYHGRNECCIGYPCRSL